MFLRQILPFILFAFATSITPGPNNLMLLNSGLNYGVLRTLPHYFGIIIGFAFMMFIVALGGGVIFVKWPWLSNALKYVGAAFMLYIAWKIARSHMSNAKDAMKKPFSFIQAALFQWMNPKAWVMTIGAVTAYKIAPNAVFNALTMGALFGFVFLLCGAVWMLSGASLQRLLSDAAAMKWVNYALAILLLLSIALEWMRW